MPAPRRSHPLPWHWGVVCLCFAALAPAASAQTFALVHAFAGVTAGDGASPSGVERDAAGRLYGVTQEGGAFGYGSVYDVDAVGHYAVRYSFANDANGYLAFGALVEEAGGTLYGTATGGGTANAGAVFSVSPTGQETVVYSFQGLADGALPASGLARDAQGRLYGTTSVNGETGGSCAIFIGCGTVFRVDPATGRETVLLTLNFDNGATPFERLVVTAQGAVYGTAQVGGDANCNHVGLNPPLGCGTVFRIDSAGHASVLHRFHGQAAGDGATPFGLVAGPDGVLYGVTLSGGTANAGALFEIDAAGHERVLYSLDGAADGRSPGGLVYHAGMLYGSAAAGGNLSRCGTTGCGTVFAYNLATGAYTVLHTFTGAGDGAYPSGPMQVDAAGRIYGTAAEGGRLGACRPVGCGTLYRVTP